MFISLLKDIDECQMIYRGQGLGWGIWGRGKGKGMGGGRSQAQELLSSWVEGVAPSQFVDVFTNLEALWTPSFQIFKEASLQRHSRLSRWLLVIELNLQPSPLPSPAVRKWGSSNLWSHGWSSGQPAPPSLLLIRLGGPRAFQRSSHWQNRRHS